MTDTAATFAIPARAASVHTNDAARQRLRARYAAERRFKWMGAAAVSVSAIFLVLLLSTIVVQAIPALRMNYLTLPLDLSPAKVNPNDAAAADYDKIVQDALLANFPEVKGRQDRRLVRGLISTGAGTLLRKDVANGDVSLGGMVNYALPLDDFSDLYMKQLLAGKGSTHPIDATLTPSAAAGDINITFDKDGILAVARGSGAIDGGNGVLKLTSGVPSLLVSIDGGVVKLNEVAPAANGGAVGKGAVYRPLENANAAAPGTSTLRIIDLAEGARKISDRQIVWLDGLKQQSLIQSHFNSQFFFTGASREPELAGVWGAVVGSFLTMLVTLSLSFPIGVSAAIYLEEFAKKNRWTNLIEVNINNLAAVPSIVFGLLGLAVFLNFFGLPRSAPLVGGMVLALMTLPIIIIASRAALRAVPPSIREAALAVGASKVQMVFHHVLPLAMPGVMTGTILGMAHALGETAPLLMIGMVAFIVDIPGGFTDPATILPVQIFMWADFPEAGFQQKTAAAILILLAFLIVMNAAAVLVRKRFERRW